MRSSDLLIDGFERVREQVTAVVQGLTVDQLTRPVAPNANPIAWLVWHLSRVQDDHVAVAAGTDQVWRTEGWHDRLGLPFDEAATGYGQSAAEVAAVRVRAELLLGYHSAVCDRTRRFLGRLTDSDLDRIVDTRWDPPVTLGVRLISVISDDLQHVGQAAYVRGIVEAMP